MSRKVEIEMTSLLDWLASDELSHEFPMWCVDKFNITKKDVKIAVNKWKEITPEFGEEDVEAICDRLGIKK